MTWSAVRAKPAVRHRCASRRGRHARDSTLPRDAAPALGRGPPGLTAIADARDIFQSNAPILAPLRPPPCG
ncbi:MAG: hypothetical protein MZV65_17890 [Chromatiales bacterium]|nr:hypothetical protein [Chromatiales bacterium]